MTSLQLIIVLVFFLVFTMCIIGQFFIKVKALFQVNEIITLKLILKLDDSISNIAKSLKTYEKDDNNNAEDDHLINQ